MNYRAILALLEWQCYYLWEVDLHGAHGAFNIFVIVVWGQIDGAASSTKTTWLVVMGVRLGWALSFVVLLATEITIALLVDANNTACNSYCSQQVCFPTFLPDLYSQHICL